MRFVERLDPEVGTAISDEYNRQKRNLELIASENAASPGVLAAMATVLNNKYAEGYPGHRYYGGCENVDVVESIAMERAKKLFGAAYANVQPHSGSQANYAVYHALVKPGDTVMGMKLSEGGHLTHGAPVSFSGLNYNIVQYGVKPDTQTIDYDEVRELAKANRPKMIIAGASAYPRVIDFKTLGEIAREVGAYFAVDIAHIAGLIAGGAHPSPLPYADVVTGTTHKSLRGPRGGFLLTNDAQIAAKLDKAIFPGSQGGPLMHVIAAKAIAFKEALAPEFKTYQEQIVKNAKALAEALLAEGFKLVSGGTDNHLMLVDVRPFDLTGLELEQRLDKVYITANKNSLPGDTLKPGVTGGLRLGTPMVTTRGLTEREMPLIAKYVKLAATKFEASENLIRDGVSTLCKEFPLYE
ncbi:MAG: serine hydroxymethyltransferase [Oscillospiraceae bacterium]|nr:serine hydroxymethyltransferase [Oscillospiraceae bacterium]